MLQSYGDTYFIGLAQALSRGAETAACPRQPQLAGAPNQEIQHQQACHQFGEHRAQGGTHHAKSRAGEIKRDSRHMHVPAGENKEEVEHHIEHTHQHVDHAGDFHVAAAAQHATG